MSKKKLINALPIVTDEVLERVLIACNKCPQKDADVFFFNIRGCGTSAVEVAAVINLVLPEIADSSEILPVSHLALAVETFIQQKAA